MSAKAAQPKKADEEGPAIEVVEPEKGCWHTFSTCVGGSDLHTKKFILVETGLM
jgi:hypothetical protein